MIALLTLLSTLFAGPGPSRPVAYAYVDANPINRTDATGLDWEDELDDLIADRVGHAMYSLGVLNEGAKWASIGLNTAVSIAGGFLPGSGLLDAFNSVQVIASGKGGFWDAVNIAGAAFPLLGKAGDAFTALRGLWKSGGYRARGLMNKCNCFVAGTMVDTPDGPRPIEWLQKGDEVWTRHHDDPLGGRRVGRVTRTFVEPADEIVWVTLVDGRSFGVTPAHEVWSNQAGWTSVGSMAAGATRE